MLHIWKKLRAKCAVVDERHDENGCERPDPRPVEMPLGFKAPPTIHEMIKRALMAERLRAMQDAAGMETLEESMDFDTGEDDELPYTPHELRDMEEEIVAQGAVEYAREQRRKEAESRKPKKAAEKPQDAPEGGEVTPTPPEPPKPA